MQRVAAGMRMTHLIEIANLEHRGIVPQASFPGYANMRFFAHKRITNNEI